MLAKAEVYSEKWNNPFFLQDVSSIFCKVSGKADLSDAEIPSLPETCSYLLRRSGVSYQTSLGATQSRWVTGPDLVDRLLVTVSLHDVLAA